MLLLLRGLSINFVALYYHPRVKQELAGLRCVQFQIIEVKHSQNEFVVWEHALDV